MAATESRIQTVCLLTLTALMISYALQLWSPVLIPFVLALALTYCVTPVIDAQIQYLRFPKLLAIVTTVLLAVVVLFLVGLLITAVVGEMGESVDDYRNQLEQLLQKTAANLPLDRLGIDADDLSGSLGLTSQTMVKLFSGTVSGVMSVLSQGTLVVIFMIFLLAGRGAAGDGAGGIRAEIEARTKKYLLTMVFVSGLTAILVGGTLAILGVRFAWMFGFLAFLLNFIPNIGSVIATLLPLPVVLLATELSPVEKTLAILIPSTVQFVIGNVVQPKVMGTSLDLHPVTIIMSLIFFGMIWGIVGMFLATPITAVIKFILERFEYTREVAEVMAGRLDGVASVPTG